MNYYAKAVLESDYSSEIQKIIELLQKEAGDNSENIEGFTVMKHNRITNDYTIMEGENMSDKVICAGKEDVFVILYNGDKLPSQRVLKRISRSPATIDFIVGGNR